MKLPSTTGMGGRKVIMTLILLISGVSIAVIRQDVPPNLLILLQTIFAGFVVGNVGEHFARKGERPAEVAPALDPGGLKKLEEQIASTQKALGILVTYAADAKKLNDRIIAQNPGLRDG